MRRTLWIGVAAGMLLSGWAQTAGADVTDEKVRAAIEKAREYLINQQKPDGSWGADAGESALVFMTLAYMGQHPNREVMAKGLDHLIRQDPDTNFGGHQGYGVPIRIMGLSYIHNKLLGVKKALVRQQMMTDLLRLKVGQSPNGGWRYGLNATDFDFSVTQWPILAMREASLVTPPIEIPKGPLRKAKDLYYSKQNEDGGWSYQGGPPSYGSMSAAGLASVYIIADILDLASGCPCRGGQSRRTTSEADKRIDLALKWLSKNFTANKNPRSDGWHLYWLYCVERVGISAGYKYFGEHNWYKEGAEVLLKQQAPTGNWGGLPDTCFATLFLFKGRAPILFNKLKFDGIWNPHRRDLANLTHFIERKKEQQFHWQIVELRSPLEELHDAPVLYISAESIPQWTDEKGKKRDGFTDEENKKLRAFTDTGGTILLEASCGNPKVRRWFPQFAKEVWPEWKPLKITPRTHQVYEAGNLVKRDVGLQGIDDGIRTVLFLANDDISCPWQMKRYTSKGYLFDFGMNLHTYATDGAPLRAKLAGRAPEKSDKYTGPVTAGGRTTLRIARVKHGGNWEVGANYAGFKRLAEHVKEKAEVTLEVEEANEPPVTAKGVAPADLKGYDVAYLTGSRPFTLTPDEQAALKACVADGGFLWLEAAGGSNAFHESVKQLADALGWELKLLLETHGLMTGRMDGAQGYNLTSGVKFRRALRAAKLGRRYADFYGLYEGGRMIGLYSPLDVLFSLTPYEAWECKGYQPEHAEAVATNIVLYLTTLDAPADVPADTPAEVLGP